MGVMRSVGISDRAEVTFVTELIKSSKYKGKGSSYRGQFLLYDVPACLFARTSNKQVMNLPRLGQIALAALFAVISVACSTSATSSADLKSVSKIFVADTAASNTLETNALNNAVHDAAVRELQRLGYAITSNSNEANATLRSSWRTRKGEGVRNDSESISLSLSLFSKSGQRLFDADSGPAVLANFWNESRANTEVIAMLARLPHAELAAGSHK